LTAIFVTHDMGEALVLGDRSRSCTRAGWSGRHAAQALTAPADDTVRS
jgi:ABC-type proline/glycine betaine transport system ATPase subunit